MRVPWILILSLAACRGGGDSVIRVGEIAALSGSEATFGQDTHQGILLAVKEINAAGGIGGKRVELKVYDTQGKEQETGTAVTRLVTSDKVVAVLGEAASSRTIAAARVTQQYGVPIITPSSTNARVTEVGDRVFRVCFIDGFQGWVMAKFTREHLKATRAAVLYDQAQAYSKGLAEEFRRHFVEMGGQIVAEQSYSGGDQDFSAQLVNVRAAAPEALFIPGYYTEVASLALQARKLGLTIPLLGGDGWDSAQLAAIGGEAVEGSFFSTHYSSEDPRPDAQAFAKKYEAEYGKPPPSTLPALGYDAARLLFTAMGRSKSLDGGALASAIAATRDFPGATGSITIDARHDARKPAVIVTVRGGQFHHVATISPP